MSNIQYQNFTLDNGLEVYVHQDKSIPKAVFNIMYRVGSKNEEPEHTGFAHLFEHLMFQGSVNVPTYDTHVQRIGGRNNAFTHFDLTNYYISLPANQLETAFWLESDRMLGLEFSEEKLEKEKSVVIEEFKQRYLNQPYGDANLHLLPLHFTKSSYRWPVIGKEIKHIEDANMAYVKSFFYKHYAPNNAALIIAGDVEVEEVKRLSEKWFGPIPRRKLDKKALPIEPKQTEPRQKTIHGDVPFTAIYKMYHIPGIPDRGHYVADMLTDILSSGRNAKLLRHMVKNKKVAAGVSAAAWGLQEPGPLSIDGQVAEGSSIEAYEKELQVVIDDLQNLTEEELVRIKNKLKSIFLLRQTTLQSKAVDLALCILNGDANLINTTPDIYQSITLDELKTMAKKLFHKNNCSTLYYLPN